VVRAHRRMRCSSGTWAGPDLLVGDQALDVMDEATRGADACSRASARSCSPCQGTSRCSDALRGSTCGGVNMSGKVSSTIAFERQFNLAMRQPDAEGFRTLREGDVQAVPRELHADQVVQPRLISREEIGKGHRA